MNENTVHWIPRFRKDPEYGHLRFKTTELIYRAIRNNIEESMVDIVNMDEFLKIDDRIPLCLGCQFDLAPRVGTEKERVFGVLGKSMLSGCVAGVGLYRYIDGEQKVIAYFHNVKEE